MTTRPATRNEPPGVRVASLELRSDGSLSVNVTIARVERRELEAVLAAAKAAEKEWRAILDEVATDA